jgi:PDZ domain
LENAGFFIPTPVISHFLKDIEDKHYDGFPFAGLRVMPLQSPAYRDLLKLPGSDTGARIDGILPIPATEKVLKPDDVLMRIGEFPVASDGTILYSGNRVSSALAFQGVQSGESIPLQVWREGQQVEVSLPVSSYDGDRAAGYQYDSLPRYLVYGGLVFTPLSLDYLRTLGRNTPEMTFGESYYELYYRKFENATNARPEPIVLASVLTDSVNANLRIRGRALVDRINGIRIQQLEDVVRAFETTTNDFDLIEFLPHHSFETLDHADVAKANSRIIKTYGITKDRRL